MNTDNPYKCDLLKEDYIECLHHRKEVAPFILALMCRRTAPIWSRWKPADRRRLEKRKSAKSGRLPHLRSTKVTDLFLHSFQHIRLLAVEIAGACVMQPNTVLRPDPAVQSNVTAVEHGVADDRLRGRR